MHIDFKVITWYKCEVPDEYNDAVVQALKDGKITCSDDISDYADDLEWIELTECQEEMTIEDNDGQATIEAYVDDHLVYTNEEA